MSVKISSLNTASTISSGDDINIAGNNPLTFSDWGGGWYMQDSVWIRSYNAKSLWIDAGKIGADGGLTIGYGGAAPSTGGAIIAGNVGIGTSSQNYKLQIRPSATFGNSEDGNISIWSSLGGGTVTNPSSVGGIIFGDENTLNSYQGRIAVVANNPSATTASHMRFYTNAGGGNSATTEKMRITAGGTLLVGDTIIPYEPSWLGTAVFGKNGTDKIITGYLTSSYNGATIGGHNSALGAWADLNLAGTNLIFRISEVEKMRITSTGRVGIGTDTPSTNLDVRGSANFRGSTYYGVTLTPTATGGDIYLYEGNNPKIYLQSAGLTLFNTGYNFLIGTTTDAGYKLDVNGDIRTSQGLYGAGILEFTGGWSASPYAN